MAGMRAVRFHAYGAPRDVLQQDRIAAPAPPPGRIRVRVLACGLNPADWALCHGLFAGALPRGIGLEVSGIVDAIGDGVREVLIGDIVMGMADYAGCSSAGAADYAVMNHWTRTPNGIDPIEAAALPMAAETAFRSLESLGVGADHLLMVHGAGTTVGFAAVQLALLRGARVVATAGDTYAERLRRFGASVTSYGDGMAERVRALTGRAPDLILDAAPVSGVLPELLRIAEGDTRRVLTISDFEGAKALGIRHSFGEKVGPCYDMMPSFAAWAAEGRLSVPIAGRFSLEDWRRARDISLGGRARGKLLLLPGA